MKSFHLTALMVGLSLSGVAGAASVDALLKDLKNTSIEVRKSALEQLEDFGLSGFTEKEGLQVLAAAGATYAPTNEYSVNADLISFLRTDPSPAYIKPIVDLFPKLDSDAKWFALDVLTRYKNNKDALKTYVGLVGKHAATLDSLPVRYLKDQGSNINILFPALFQYTKFPELQYNIYDLALSFLYDEDMEVEMIQAQEKQVLSHYQTLATRLKAAQKPDGLAWRWEEPYNSDRFFGGLMLDLIGIMNTKQGNAVLKEALNFQDPHLKGWAAISMVFNKLPVPVKDMEAVAASHEMRWTLFDYLQRAERTDLFPEAYNNQQALAAAKLVDWLTYPAELGYEPESIEYVKTFTEEGEKAKYDYFLFRFTDQEGKAYAGVAGPFKQGEPTIDGGEDTFSNFTEWDKLTPDEHYEEILGTLDEYSGS